MLNSTTSSLSSTTQKVTITFNRSSEVKFLKHSIDLQKLNSSLFLQYIQVTFVLSMIYTILLFRVPWFQNGIVARYIYHIRYIYFIKTFARRVWRYQRGNQNPYIEKGQTTQWSKETGQTTQWSKETVQKDKQRSTNHTHKTKDRVTRAPLKTGGELVCSGRVTVSEP